MLNEKLIINERASLEKTVKKLDDNGLGIVCVTDINGTLKGIMTDGDFRRSIIEGASLKDDVSKWMNKNFIHIEEKSGLRNQYQPFVNNQIRHMPITKNGKLVNVLFFKDYVKKNIPVILMVGGLGSRLYPLTKTIPKPMIEIGGKPILQRIIEEFVLQGFTKIILSVNYKKEQILDYFQDGKLFGADITYIKEEKPLGTAGSLSLMKKYISNYNSFIVMNGDILTKIDFTDLLNFHIDNNSDITVCSRKYSYDIPFGVIENDDNKINQIVEKPTKMYNVSSGAYIFKSNVLGLLQDNEFEDIPLFINKLINNGYNAYYYNIKDFWFDIGTIEQLEKARQFYL